MRLSQLRIHAVRNLKDLSLTCHPTFNWIIGRNGSGKTSVLEAIHLLALGRSFRSRHIQSLIAYGASSFACFGEIMGEAGVSIAMGIEKSTDGEVKCKLQGEICSRLSEFASVLPIQLITPETFRLLTAGAEERRRFLDWGVFHVEHSFAALCQTYHRALKQRNAALKIYSQENDQIKHWEEALIVTGERIALQRGVYFAALEPFIQAACQDWLPNMRVEIGYCPGWEEGSLGMAIEAARKKDRHRGYTSVGPHRGELEMRVEGFPAHQVLSRGQQKLLIFALYGAQAQQLAKQAGKQSVFLVDDIASELDPENRAKLLTALRNMQHQIFLTAISLEGLSETEIGSDSQMFHVEHL